MFWVCTQTTSNNFLIGRAALALAVTVSLPYNCFMPRQGLMCMIYSCIPARFSENKTVDNVLHYVTTLVISISVVVIAFFVSDLGATFEIIGGVSACTIAYIIPPLLNLRLSKGWFTPNKAASVIVLMCGIFIFCGSLGATVYRLVTQGS